MKIFFSGPLTNLKDPEKTKAFYDKMAEVVKANGCEYFLAFRNGTDPIQNPDVPPHEVYERDLGGLKDATIMITYLGEPSTGTGMEIQYASEHNIPVYALYQTGDNVSRMVRGCPIIKLELVYSNEEDALKQLDHLVKQLKAEYDAPPVVSPPQ